MGQSGLRLILNTQLESTQLNSTQLDAMRCEAEKKAVQMFSYVMPFETLDKHGGIIEKAKKYRNRKLLKKYCYYQAEGREGETQRDRKRE